MSRHDRSELRELIPAYLAGDVSEEERQALDRALDLDPELELEVRGWSETLADLAEGSGEPLQPSAELRQQLLARVAGAARQTRAPVSPEGSENRFRAASPAPPRERVSWQPLALAASIAALVLALGAVWVQIRLREQVETVQAERDVLAQRVQALEGEQADARQRVDQLAAAVSAVVDPGRQPVRLASLSQDRDASGATFYRRAAGALFYAFGLPQLEAGRTYQLWYIGAQGAVSAGIFEVDELGEATVRVAEVPAPETIAAWAVTVEPAGGVPQPTGPMVIRS
jgi:anti-sigma-K factor RskA